MAAKRPIALAGRVVVYPAPAGEKASGNYQASVDGQEVFVYSVGTLNGKCASFASFDFFGEVTVEVRSTRAVGSAKVLPTSYGIVPEVKGDTIRFELSEPRNVTIEINGSIEDALHLFGNPMETDAPREDDPNVLYFGPGVHKLGPTRLKSHQTLYLAGGAIVRPTIPAEEQPLQEKNWAGNKVYRNLIEAHEAKDLSIRGRGILDMSQLPWHARTAIVLDGCEEVRVEGITMLDTPAWGVAMFGSRNVTVRNIKQICRRENSDGVDICNSQQVLVEDCFLRNNDDEVCVKTTAPPPALESKDILVRRCVVWNERARGLGITSETRQNISNVVFRDCDIIHDYSTNDDCASMAILVSDSGTMSGIRFEDIRVEQSGRKLANCWIGADMWGHDTQRGHVRGVVFREITVTGGGLGKCVLSGFDEEHRIEDVSFEGLRINGKVVSTLEEGNIVTNTHTRNIRVAGSEAKL